MRRKLQTMWNLHDKGTSAQILLQALPYGILDRSNHFKCIDWCLNDSQRVAKLPMLFSDDRNFTDNLCIVYAMRANGCAPIIHPGKLFIHSTHTWLEFLTCSFYRQQMRKMLIEWLIEGGE